MQDCAQEGESHEERDGRHESPDFLSDLSAGHCPILPQLRDATPPPAGSEIGERKNDDEQGNVRHKRLMEEAHGTDKHVLGSGVCGCPGV